MLTVPTVLRALPDLYAAGGGLVAIAAAGTAGALGMDPQLDPAQWALRLDNRSDCSLSVNRK
jgi:hypothetical protein